MEFNSFAFILVLKSSFGPKCLVHLLRFLYTWPLSKGGFLENITACFSKVDPVSLAINYRRSFLRYSFKFNSRCQSHYLEDLVFRFDQWVNARAESIATLAIASLFWIFQISYKLILWGAFLVAGVCILKGR